MKYFLACLLTLFAVGTSYGQSTLSGTKGSIQKVLTPSGTYAAPSYTFAEDSTLGMLRPSANTIGFAVGGVEAARIGTDSLTVGRNAAGVGALKIQGASTGYVDAHLILEADGVGRGAGTYYYNDGNDATWFMGSPYGTTDRLTFLRKGSTSSFSTTVADPATSEVYGIISNVGSWSLGCSSCAANHDITSVALTGAVLQVRNYNTSALSEPGLLIAKAPNNTTSANYFVQFRINGTTNSGVIAPNGANTAAFATLSDRRLKENISDLPPQLENIKNLKPKEFDYKDGSGHQIGFVAQEMQDVYPDAVSTTGEGYLQISGWDKTDARLVKAIQEQQAIIESLKARLDAAGL